MSDRRLTPTEDREGRNLMEFFRGLIALHRHRKGFERGLKPGVSQEWLARMEEVRRSLVESLAMGLRGFSMQNSIRAKAFSAELATGRYDLGCADEVIIQDVLRKVTR